MAKSRVPLMLRASFTSTTAEQPSYESVNIDLSAYVDALSGKVLKVNKVTFITDDASGGSFGTASFDGSGGGTWVAQLITGAQTSLKGANDDRMIAERFTQAALTYKTGVDFTSSNNTPVATGVVFTFYDLEVPDAGFYVAADQLTFAAQHNLDIDVSARHICVIEAERVKLTAADVNFLLVNQTLTG
jgi:hypothetical protein